MKNPSAFACLVPEIKNFGQVFITVIDTFHAGLALYKQLFLCLISIFLLNYISLIFNFTQDLVGFLAYTDVGWCFYLVPEVLK